MTLWIIKSETDDPERALKIVAEQRTKGYAAWIEDGVGPLIARGRSAHWVEGTREGNHTRKTAGLPRLGANQGPIDHKADLPNTFAFK